MKSSEYIENERKSFSLYVLSDRAIPHITDGLKAGARRVLWMAKDGKKYKCSALAGACAPIHPHVAPEGIINTLAASYGNNISLLTGFGAFGTLLKPTSYGASRYTSVSLSNFAKDVLLKDIELIPLTDNYDGTLQEPKHFLPIIPIVLLNYQEGIAVGFASKILPRSLTDIISDQILYLTNQQNKINSVKPYFAPTNQTSHKQIDTFGKQKWYFEGAYKKINATTVCITELPYGLSHQKLLDKLELLENDDKGTISKIVDDSSDEYKITVHFKKGILSKLDEDSIKQLLGITNSISENMNVINFDGSTVWPTSYIEIISKFTEWRLQYYVIRYERLVKLLKQDIQRLQDIMTAILKNVNSISRKIKSRTELKEYLKAIDIINIDYISDLPIYRFTEEEKTKTEKKLEDNLKTLNEYNEILSSEDKRKKIYITELREILKNANNNRYNQME